MLTRREMILGVIAAPWVGRDVNQALRSTGCREHLAGLMGDMNGWKGKLWSGDSPTRVSSYIYAGITDHREWIPDGATVTEPQPGLFEWRLDPPV